MNTMPRVLLVALSLSLVSQNVTAARRDSLHPPILLKDAQGRNVLQSGQPLSTMVSCGECHDTGVIAGHSYHVSAGFGEMSTAGPGLPYPLLYDGGLRDADPAGPASLEFWVRSSGARHVGGGPASLLAAGSGEMNCFLCHLPDPDNAARIRSIQQGLGVWAPTATLAGTGLATSRPDGSWAWNASAFAADGRVVMARLPIQDPSTENCGLCHGLAGSDLATPVFTDYRDPALRQTLFSGEIFSPQKLLASGLNLKDKDTQRRAWDIHAERALECVDCHHSLNNPVYFAESGETRPAHLRFEARRLDMGEYLRAPSHQFARGHASAFGGASAQDNSMRRCESCHDAEAVHDWLPFKLTHFNALSCEACHIPRAPTASLEAVDWTLPGTDHSPRLEYRGAEGDPRSLGTLITGSTPVLLPRQDVDGRRRLAPFNLVTSWYWTWQSPGGERPVPLPALDRALRPDGQWLPGLLELLDANHDGGLDSSECVLEDAAVTRLVFARLEADGFAQATIRGEIRPWALSHGVTGLAYARKDCQECHARESRVFGEATLGSLRPGADGPHFAKGLEELGIFAEGELVSHGTTAAFRSAPRSGRLYILGHDKAPWIKIVGLASLLGVLLLITIHGTLRVLASRRLSHEHGPWGKTYMYTSYERFWHWLQALAIIGLIATGLTIHAPELFAFSGFRSAVQVHNILGFVLLVNAFFSLFYHVAGGSVRQYLPEPRGFFAGAITQLLFYVQGIFKGEPHPFEKSRGQKLNPLQKIAYLIILNLLLPFQVLSGVLIWGAQHWPGLEARLGGLPMLVPAHSLGAWFFASFLIMHIYLTTTGHTPTANLRAMISGYERIPTHNPTETAR